MWDLNDNIKDMANELVREGYAVLAGDLFHEEIATDPSRVRELTSSVTDNPRILTFIGNKNLTGRPGVIFMLVTSFIVKKAKGNICYSCSSNNIIYSLACQKW